MWIVVASTEASTRSFPPHAHRGTMFITLLSHLSREKATGGSRSSDRRAQRIVRIRGTRRSGRPSGLGRTHSFLALHRHGSRMDKKYFRAPRTFLLPCRASCRGHRESALRIAYFAHRRAITRAAPGGLLDYAGARDRALNRIYARMRFSLNVSAHFARSCVGKFCPRRKWQKYPRAMPGHRIDGRLCPIRPSAAS